MTHAVASRLSSDNARTRWRDLILPKEHGSWSLALEPVALGLLVAPSPAGGWLALATFFGFLLRRPLKIALRDGNPVRCAAAYRACAVLAIIAGTAFVAAVQAGATAWLGWIVPPATLGAFFLTLDLRNHGRVFAAELIGAAAFSLIAGAIVAADERPTAIVLAVLATTLARTLPTVIFVRACIRGHKAGQPHPGPAILTAFGVAALSFPAWHAGFVPVAVPVALTLLLLRALLWTLRSHRPPRAQALGIQEAIVGTGYVFAIAAMWPR